MPIIYRDSTTWPADATGDTETVVGDSEDMLGDGEGSAAALLVLLFGDPLQQILSSEGATVAMKRRVTLTATVGG